MFYVLSKALDLFLGPLTWVVLLLLASLILRKRRPGTALGCGILSLLILWIFSTESMSSWLWRRLEAPAASTMKSGVQYDAVIVLSGMVDGAATEVHGQPAYNDNIERLLVPFRLLRDGRVKNVLISGGYSTVDGSGPKEADVLAQQLRDWGIEPARIFTERDSRNTRENATESAKVVAQNNWKTLLMVTSAFHMPRAQASFEKAGLNPDVLPVDYRGSRGGIGLMPRAGALAISTSALRELAGRLVYRVVGYAR